MEKIIVEHGGERIDKFLAQKLDKSRSLVQKLIKDELVLVNGEVVKTNYSVADGDEIDVKQLDVVDNTNIIPQPMDLDIVYEDDDLLVINKASGMVVHPAPGHYTGTLVNALLYRFNLNSGEANRPGIVHRLDKDTSGLIMIAKNDYMMAYLQETMKKREKIGKYYLAIVSWIIENKEFKIESFIWRHPVDKTRMTTKNPINPKIAISYVKVIKYIDEKYTLVEVKIETWRTHQIRVHLSSIGYPIIWDKVYWDKKINEIVLNKFWLTRQALHSYRLEIELYWKNREFFWELKPDMKKILN